jgi:hypothetical protein
LVELALPKNSQIVPGKSWPKLVGANKPREFRNYRQSPERANAFPLTGAKSALSISCGPIPQMAR